MNAEANVSDEDLRRFVLDGLAEDERRLAREELPVLDEAERQGRLRVLRTDDGQGLVLVPGPAQAMTERTPVPFEEKARWLREEVEGTGNHDVLRLLAAAYDTRHGWQEEWRPTPVSG
ncbi:hypothetical protein ACFV4N_41690 [Actinosynnema sp. NPDC059797]